MRIAQRLPAGYLLKFAVFALLVVAVVAAQRTNASAEPAPVADARAAAGPLVLRAFAAARDVSATLADAGTPR